MSRRPFTALNLPPAARACALVAGGILRYAVACGLSGLSGLIAPRPVRGASGFLAPHPCRAPRPAGDVIGASPARLWAVGMMNNDAPQAARSRFAAPVPGADEYRHHQKPAPKAFPNTGKRGDLIPALPRNRARGGFSAVKITGEKRRAIEIASLNFPELPRPLPCNLLILFIMGKLGKSGKQYT